MKRTFVDTNIFLRYLTRDDDAKYARCRDLFADAVEGKTALATSGIVIAELIWTLSSYYKVPKADIIEKVIIIVSTENLFIPDKDMIAEALVLYGRKNIDYIDAYNAAFMKHHGVGGIWSYDRDYDLIDEVKRYEP